MYPKDMVTAATAKSLQSCPTLCDPIDCSPPGSSVPGILQARTMEWRNLPSLNVGLLNILKVLLEKAMAIHSSTLAWKIPWMEEPGRLQSMGSLRVRHN